VSEAEQLAAKLVATYKDGFQISDLWETVTTLMDHAEDFLNEEGQVKKDFVLNTLEEVLKQVDLPGPDFITRRVVLWFMPSLIDKLVELKFG
jgi:hypothetical protein